MNGKTRGDLIRDYVDQWPLDNWNLGTCLFVDRLREQGLTDLQIAVVLRTIEEICNYCWDSDKPCTCMRDD